MNPTHKIEIEGKTHYIKKGLFGSVREVYPIKIDGKIAWKNLLIGSAKQLVSLLIYLGIAALIYFGMQNLLNQCEVVLNDPCSYCFNISHQFPA